MLSRFTGCLLRRLMPTIASSLLKAYDLELGFDWMGGLIWIGGKGAGLGQKVRQTMKDFNGHATLMRGTEGHRRDVGVFQPQAAPQHWRDV